MNIFDTIQTKLCGALHIWTYFKYIGSSKGVTKCVLMLLWHSCDIRWKPRVMTMPTLSLLAAPQVVMITTNGAASDGKAGIMKTPSFPLFVFSCVTGIPSIDRMWQATRSWHHDNSWFSVFVFGVLRGDLLLTIYGRPIHLETNC